ncbi:VOC family protein [Brevundimonas aveniformis]|uniref:VOC family protein n=1 Tax=Brevundimonas aveniformis TaxID=370977 RepID=UPI000429723C|nr:VOC family protein [Brevundimonas aveniformis]
MDQMIFINLPVTELNRSIAFYEAVGATKNPMFSDDTAACMVLSNTIYVMLLTHAKWATFGDVPIHDAHKGAQVFLCLTRPDKPAVDRVVEQAGTAGGRPDPTPSQDYGFMYGRSFADPDGHIWENVWMDPQAAAEGPPDMAAKDTV